MNLARAFFIFVSLLLSGCAATHANNPADPFESYNRGAYKFNDVLDKAALKPLAKGYHAVVPPFGRTMVSNFFSNLNDVTVTINDLLQFKLAQGLSDATRFLVNSTIGIFGLFDVASKGNLVKHNEDFGQTLGKWGIGSGPYLVLPIFGPSTVRDGTGLYADSQLSLIREIDHIPTRNQVYATQAVSNRAALLNEERILNEAAIDRYAFIRDAYLQRRKSLVYDGNPPPEKYDDEVNNVDDVDDTEPVSATLDEPITPVGNAVEITLPVTTPLPPTENKSPPNSTTTPLSVAHITTAPDQSANQQPAVHKIWLPASR